MNKLYFYTLPDSYIAYLSSLDNRVCLNKEQKRPYIGIVFKVGEINYFAPFTSPKAKHKTMTKAIDYVKVRDGELGIINLNNMIPVPLEICNKIDITDIVTDKYKSLVQKQYKCCNEENNYKNIVGSARRLY